MLPKTLRFCSFEALSLKTMRYVRAIPRRKAAGLVAQVYEMTELAEAAGGFLPESNYAA